MELYQLSDQIGFVEGKIVERFDCYDGTSATVKLSKDLYVQGVNFFARKPQSFHNAQITGSNPYQTDQDTQDTNT